ncbi:hypothetical protein [Advenella sp. FME57]|uniref:hypothetical protein n=1 Tax=Advenella sp. FME57 TaxID=2742604 RepID=UPI0018695000|nr:hypothetical protein [Advenella sp. FME57]
MSDVVTSNPFTASVPSQARVGGNAVAQTDQQRAIAEVQAAMMIARMNPRDPIVAMDRILNACARPTLADAAVYTYSKGGSDVSGPSIRLAEAMAQAWGNIQFGIRELDQDGGESTVQAYAWDVETNTRREITFQVPHVRYTRKGSYDLKDPREVYELVANQGARRLRACILAVIPGDVTEAAVAQCEATMKSKADTSPEAMQKMVAAFAEFGVTKEQIEKRIQRRLDAIQPAQVVSLKKIYASLRDGMSTALDWFENDQADSTKQTEAASRTESVKAKAKAQREAAQAAKEKNVEDTKPTVDADGVVKNAPAFDYQSALREIQRAPTQEKLDLLAEGLRNAPEDTRIKLEQAYNDRKAELEDIPY